MISALSPAFLWAGAALALVPLALHFVARRPPERRPLPTARFLREDARTELRVERRPRDLPLLLVRMAFALVAGAVFAGVTWSPDRQGARHVVLVDAGPSTAGAWEDAVEAVREVLERARADGEAAEILAYGLDGGPRPVDEDALGALEGGTGPATFEDGLRALRRHLVEETRVASARVTWVTSPRWSAWPEGFGLLRPALWPGRIDVVTVGAPPVSGPPEPGRERPLALTPGAAPDGPLALALDALGWRVGRGTAPGEPASSGAAGGGTAPGGSAPGGTGGGGTASGGAAGSGTTWAQDADAAAVFANGPAEAELDALEGRARRGATVVVWGDARDPRSILPWRRGPAGAGGGSPGALVLADGVTLDADLDDGGGQPAAAARIVAVFENGAPAAAARPVGEGCMVFAAVPLEGPSLAALPDYPRLIAALAGGCAAPAGDDGALDAGALAVLEGRVPGGAGGADPGDGASVGDDRIVDVAALAIPGGRPLAGALIALALLLLAADVALARRDQP